jgi:hypothetical protein
MAAVIAPADATRGKPLNLALLGFSLAATLIAAGLLLPTNRLLNPESGFGYALGILGGTMMLALLIYPLRKRNPKLAFIGGTRRWFKVHMFLGVAGPLCILYHANFSTGATNSNVALACMLVVSGSGVIGRYLYARIHHGLYGHRATLAELRSEAAKLRETNGANRILPDLQARMEAAEARIERGWPFVPKPVSASLQWRIERRRLRTYVRHGIGAAACDSTVAAEHAHALGQSARRYVDRRLSSARRLAEFAACERLFALWHVLHLPLFFMLVIAGVVHVVAVHVY